MKARTCNQSVALLIKKHSLLAVKAAVDMAYELQRPEPTPKKKAAPKIKTMTAGGELPERFDR